MEILLDKKRLSSETNPAGSFWRWLTPWSLFMNIGLEAATINQPSCPGDPPWGRTESSLGKYQTGQIALKINQGGLQNRYVDAREKESFRWAIDGARMIHPEIPEKPTGWLTLHYADSYLKKAVLNLK